MASSTKLHDAVRHDRCRLISRLVAEGTPVDAVDASGNSALFVAITDGPRQRRPLPAAGRRRPELCASLHYLSGGRMCECTEVCDVAADAARARLPCTRRAVVAAGPCSSSSWSAAGTCGCATPRAAPRRTGRWGTPTRSADASWSPSSTPSVLWRIGLAMRPLYWRTTAQVVQVASTALPPREVQLQLPALHRRLVGRPAAPRRPWCGERIRADGGFGVVYCSPARETGVTTFVPFIASNYLYNSEENNIIWSGPQSLMQTMYWDKLKVSVKKSSLSGSHSRGPGSDILITELEKVRRLSFHPYLLWPLAVSPVQNMDDMLLVFECIHFGSLFDILHNAQQLLGGRGSLDHGRLLLVLQQTCEALLFLHSRQWVHGCVSSHCIYVVSPCLGKLGNFEFVQRSEDAEGNDAYSPPTEDFLDFYCHWLAPEVLTGSRPTKMADLYQFCVILWEVFTEEVPLVHAGLALDPAERHTDLEDVYQALAAIVQEGQGNVGFALGRLEQAGDTCRVKSTPGKPLPSRQASTVEVEHAAFVHRPTSMRRRAPSTIADDVSDTVEELISLVDERAAPLHRSPPRRPNRSQPTRGTFTTTTATSAQADLLDSKFDQISLTSSLDPMEYM
ncbi:hypothetical protein MTO96_031358 [Rhipicephalus appendiculatus]